MDLRLTFAAARGWGVGSEGTDPDSSGTLIDFNEIGWARAYEETTRLLKSEGTAPRGRT